MLAVSTFPPFQLHIEVWLLMAAVAGLGIYVARVIQPKAVAAGHPPISRRQKCWFWSAWALLWIFTDFPIHDVAELRLYSVHMIQHAMLTVVIPPMMLLAIPTWLARLVLGDGLLDRFVRFWSRPIPAIIVYNFLIAISHWAFVVNGSVDSAPLHYTLHALLVMASFLVFMSICGPLPELQSNPPMKMVTLFLVSIIPTIPAAFLTVAETVLYSAYDQPVRLWGFDVVRDQQLAGVIMKVITGFYLWGIIAVIFFKWSMSGDERKKFRGKLVNADGEIVERSADEGSEKPTPVAH